MTEKEKDLLCEYRYNKLCQLENNSVDSYNVLVRDLDNRSALNYHFYDVVYLECFKNIMCDIFELLKLKESNNNE